MVYSPSPAKHGAALSSAGISSFTHARRAWLMLMSPSGAVSKSHARGRLLVLPLTMSHFAMDLLRLPYLLAVRACVPLIDTSPITYVRTSSG